jgi:cytochrome c biogenesis protein CcmG, thiol:disulfide interchange protein DsbE
LSRRPARILIAILALFGMAAGGGQVGALAPDFSRTDLDGKVVHLSAFRGRLVLLNFWASWCGPCLAEMPQFSRWQAVYGPRGLQVIGISMDDDVRPVEALLRRRPVSYPIVVGDAALGRRFGGVLGLPMTYLIGPDGSILARYDGETHLGAIEAAVTRALPRRFQ